jgi:hypothetical protein
VSQLLRLRPLRAQCRSCTDRWLLATSPEQYAGWLVRVVLSRADLYLGIANRQPEPHWWSARDRRCLSFECVRMARMHGATASTGTSLYPLLLHTSFSSTGAADRPLPMVLSGSSPLASGPWPSQDTALDGHRPASLQPYCRRGVL